MPELTEEQKKRLGLGQQRIKKDEAWGQQVEDKTFDANLQPSATTVPKQQPVEPTAPVAEQQPSESQRYIDQILKQYEEHKKQNAEADKRDRVREAIGGIGDVASALAKLHYTTQYAPYVPSENLSEKARQRYEKAKANRDANLDQWMHYMLNVAGKKQAAEQAEKTRQDTKAWRDAQAAETKRYHDETLKLQQDRLKQQEAAQKERNELQRQRNEISKLKTTAKTSGGRGSRNYKSIPVYDEDGTTFNIPGDRDPKIALGTVYSFIPEQERYKYNKDQAKAIGEYLGDPDGNPDIKANIRDYLKVLAGQPKTSSRGSMPGVGNNNTGK